MSYNSQQEGELWIDVSISIAALVKELFLLWGYKIIWVPFFDMNDPRGIAIVVEVFYFKMEFLLPWLCSLGWTWTWNPPISTSQVLVLHVCAAVPALPLIFQHSPVASEVSSVDQYLPLLVMVQQPRIEWALVKESVADAGSLHFSRKVPLGNWLHQNKRSEKCLPQEPHKEANSCSNLDLLAFLLRTSTHRGRWLFVDSSGFWPENSVL